MQTLRLRPSFPANETAATHREKGFMIVRANLILLTSAFAVAAADLHSGVTVKAIHAEVDGFHGAGEHFVSLKPGKFVRSKERNLLDASLTKQQIEALPVEPRPN